MGIGIFGGPLGSYVRKLMTTMDRIQFSGLVAHSVKRLVNSEPMVSDADRNSCVEYCVTYQYRLLQSAVSNAMQNGGMTVKSAKQEKVKKDGEVIMGSAAVGVSGIATYPAWLLSITSKLVKVSLEHDILLDVNLTTNGAFCKVVSDSVAKWKEAKEKATPSSVTLKEAFEKATA